MHREAENQRSGGWRGSVGRANEAAAWRREYGARGVSVAHEARRGRARAARRRRRVERALRRARRVGARVRALALWWREEDRKNRAREDS